LTASFALSREPGVPTRGRTSNGWLVLVALLVVAYGIATWVATLGTARVSYLVLQPVGWLLPGTAALVLARVDVAPDSRARPYLLIAIGIAAAQAGLLLVAGLLTTFGRSPFNHGIASVATSLWYGAAVLVGQELARSQIIRILRPRHAVIAAILPAALLFLLALPMGSLTTLPSAGNQAWFSFLGNFVFPAAGLSVFATYLAFRAGNPLPAIAYRSVLLLFVAIPPILPDPPWALVALVGLGVPASAVFLIPTSDSLDRVGTIEMPRWQSLRWFVLGMAVVALVWLNTGVFGVRPSIVDGGSMEPTMRTGDIVVVQTVRPDRLKVGDVVMYHFGRKSVVHRIVAMDGQPGSPTLETRGDANRVNDVPVPFKGVQGRVVLTIPSLGQPVIWTREQLGRLLHQ
jgi:signal peptidase